MIMNTRQNRLIIFALLLLTQTPLGAQLHSTKIELPEDSISATMEDSIPAKRSFFKKFLDYFNDANKEKKNKKFDFSVIGGPHYSSDTKFGLGLVAAGLYRTDRNDSLLKCNSSVMWESFFYQYVTIECNISRHDISFQSSLCTFFRKSSCHDLLVFHLAE